MLKLFRVISLFCLFPLILTAQESGKFNQKVTVSPGPGTSTTSNDILKILSEGNGKTPRNTLYTVATTQTVKAIYQNNSYVVTVQSSTPQVNGDIMYRGFSMETALIPASFTYTLKVTATNFTKEFKAESSISGSQVNDYKIAYKDSIQRNISFQISDFKVTYTATELNEVKSRADLIKKYYSSVTELDHHYQQLQTIDAYDYTNFRTLLSRIDQSRHAYEDIKNANLLSALQSENNDPAKLKDKLISYEHLLKEKQDDANRVLSTLHLVFNDRGNDAMRNGDYRAAYDLYHLSLEVNPGFAPAMLQLARIDFIRNDLKEASCKADEIVYRMLPDPATRSNTLDLIRNIRDSYIDRGLNFTVYKKYDQALDEFAQAGEICKHYPEIRCNDEIEKGIEKVHYALYKDELQAAKNLFAQSNISASESRVNQAIAYHQKHINGEPSEAYELLSKIRQKKYDNLSAAGKQLTERGDYENAVKSFTEADILLHEYELQKSQDFDKYSRIAAGKQINNLITQSEAAVKTNNVTSAKSDLQTVYDLQSRFGLTNDKSVNDKTTSLRNKIFTRECANAQASVDSTVIASRALIAARDYLAAFEILEKGKQISDNFSSCKLFTDSLFALLLKVRHPGTYLQLMASVQSEISAAKYSKALDDYTKASAYYADNNVKRFDIQHNTDRDAFVLSTNDNGMINYCAAYDMEHGNLENSLKLYKLLLNRNYHPAFMDASLYELGRKTGAADKVRAPGGKGKKLAARYTGGDKRLKKFAKGYVKGYN